MVSYSIAFMLFTWGVAAGVLLMLLVTDKVINKLKADYSELEKSLLSLDELRLSRFTQITGYIREWFQTGAVRASTPGIEKNILSMLDGFEKSKGLEVKTPKPGVRVDLN